MSNPLKILLLSLTLFCLGCSSKIIKIPSLIVPSCSAPIRPDLYLLDNSSHIASMENIENILVTMSELVIYIKQLEIVINCLKPNGGK